ncbi:hypothetical protein HOY80DRAFT_1098869, partial [Tuber brumale]
VIINSCSIYQHHSSYNYSLGRSKSTHLRPQHYKNFIMFRYHCAVGLRGRIVNSYFNNRGTIYRQISSTQNQKATIGDQFRIDFVTGDARSHVKHAASESEVSEDSEDTFTMLIQVVSKTISRIKASTYIIGSAKQQELLSLQKADHTLDKLTADIELLYNHPNQRNKLVGFLRDRISGLLDERIDLLKHLVNETKLSTDQRIKELSKQEKRLRAFSRNKEGIFNEMKRNRDAKQIVLVNETCKILSELKACADKLIREVCGHKSDIEKSSLKQVKTLERMWWILDSWYQKLDTD